MHWATQSVEKQLRRLGSVEILSDHVMVRRSKMESHEPPVSVSVSPGEMLRLLVKQQVHAAVEESSGLLDTLTAAYEDTVSQLREHERRASDVQQLVGIKADVPPEDQDQEEPEPLLIKEELQDLWTRLEGDQLIVLEEADITKFLSTAVTVKSEDDEPQTSRLHQSQTENNKEAEPPACSSATTIQTETDGEDCGASGPDRNLNPHRHSHPNADDEEASDSSETEVSYGDWQEALSDSGPESEDGDNVWKEPRTPESAAHALKYKEALVSHVGCNTGNKSNESRSKELMREKAFRCDEYLHDRKSEGTHEYTQERNHSVLMFVGKFCKKRSMQVTPVTLPADEPTPEDIWLRAASQTTQWAS
ncbi:uncharacterized protein LOC130198345 [Pseudoliparis swirei]|uniref:uncharacterized protein LOC130198345 n=1 Tax=Pseudoliparis swirei TaxID=2059687 RepID=UPI0024BDDC50|nr:uncharacterized protein LOC130198345 [Pseudoliparis swirei]